MAQPDFHAQPFFQGQHNANNQQPFHNTQFNANNQQQFRNAPSNMNNQQHSHDTQPNFNTQSYFNTQQGYYPQQNYNSHPDYNAQPPFGAFGPFPGMDPRFGRRGSRETIAGKSAIVTSNEKSQQKGDEDDVGQGLIVLYDRLAAPTKNDAAKKKLEGMMVDIVAIPGLETHPKNTWEKRLRISNQPGDSSHPFKSGLNCLEDRSMLRQELPESRIMTYSYASDWQGVGKGKQHQPVKQGIEEVADVLLKDLKRQRKDCPNRPIILIGHSLGGIVLEKTVNKAKRFSEYSEIYNSIVGCVFLGTPFKGSATQAKAAYAAKMGFVFGVSEYTPLLKLMESNSGHLADMLDEFLAAVKEDTIQVCCFYELKETDVSGIYRNKLLLGNFLPAQTEMIADFNTSTLQIADNRPLNRDHFNMNKFDSNRERDWATFSSVIKDMYAKASRVLKSRRNALPDGIEEKYDGILKALGTLEADPEVELETTEDTRGEAIMESRKVVLQHDKIKTWLDAAQMGLLWISLYPNSSGNSKMYAAAFIRRVEEDKSASQFSECLCYFFCDSMNAKKNNTLSVIKAFIRQILPTNKRLALHLPYEPRRNQKTKKQTGNNHSSWDSLDNLKVALIAMIKDPLVTSITLVLDSLHKIDDDSRSDMLDFINESLQIRSQDGTRAKVRWICLGIDQQDVKMKMQPTLTVTYQELGNEGEMMKFLKPLVRNKVVELSSRLGYTREYTFWLRTELLNRAEGNATWVDLAVGEIANVAPKAIDLRSFTEHLKRDLTPLYRQIHERVFKPGTEGLEYTKEILRTMLIVYHTPTLREIAVLSGLPQEIWDDSDAIRGYVKRCGSFLKIVPDDYYYDAETVEFIDTTALDYLNKEATDTLGSGDRLRIQDGIVALRCLNFLLMKSNKEEPASNIKAVYTKKFWLDHAVRATQELPDLIEDFGLDEGFWNAERSMKWWPRTVRRNWPKLHKFTTVHLAAYFDYPILLDVLLAEDSNHKDELGSYDALGRTPLYWACDAENFKVAQLLVKHGADVNAYDHDNPKGLAPLYGAAQNGHIEIVHWLLTQGALVDIPNKIYGTALCGAAAGGYEEVFKLLLSAGAYRIAPPEWPKGSFVTAACAAGHATLARFMINEHFDVTIPNKNGYWPIEYAVFNQDAELVNMLLWAGSPIKGRQDALDAAALAGFEEGVRLILQNPSDLTMKQALLNAADQGHPEVLNLLPYNYLTQQDLDEALYRASDMEQLGAVQKLLSMGANANAKGETYGNALIASVWDGTIEITKTLLAHGANVNEVTGPYGTALQAAAYQGEKDLVLCLLQSGANVNEGPVGEYGNALYAACVIGNMDIVNILVQHGANVNAPGGPLYFALIAAVENRRSEAIEFLVEHGADVNATTDDGTSVILKAAYTLPQNELKYLYEHGANVHTRDREGLTVLIVCADYQDLTSIEWLVTLGVDINAVSESVGSALQAAASHGNEEICEILLKHGANPNQVDDNNAPALIKATLDSDKETFDVLLKYGADVNYNSDKWGNLVEAAIEANADEILRNVLDKGHFDVNALLREQGSPLHMASRSNYGWSVCDLLLGKCADPNVVGGKYHTPLQAAAYKGFTDLISSLMDHGADKTIRGGFYETASNCACALGWSTLPTTLLGEEGGSATDEGLHYAIHYHQYAVVEMLLDDMKADVTSTGKWGNVFQALSTALTADEINSDDENEDGDDDEEEEDEEGEEEDDDDNNNNNNNNTNGSTEDDEEVYDDDDGDDDDDDEEGEAEETSELTDEEKVKRIDEMLRNAFKAKGIDHSTLPKDPITADFKRSKSFMKMTKKQNIAANGYANSSQVPPVPTLDTSQYAQSPAAQAHQAGARAGEYIRGFFSSFSGHSNQNGQTRSMDQTHQPTQMTPSPQYGQAMPNQQYSQTASTEQYAQNIPLRPSTQTGSSQQYNQSNFPQQHGSGISTQPYGQSATSQQSHQVMPIQQYTQTGSGQQFVSHNPPQQHSQNTMLHQQVQNSSTQAYHQNAPVQPYNQSGSLQRSVQHDTTQSTYNHPGQAFTQTPQQYDPHDSSHRSIQTTSTQSTYNQTAQAPGGYMNVAQSNQHDVHTRAISPNEPAAQVPYHAVQGDHSINPHDDQYNQPQQRDFASQSHDDQYTHTQQHDYQTQSHNSNVYHSHDDYSPEQAQHYQQDDSDHEGSHQDHRDESDHEDDNNHYHQGHDEDDDENQQHHYQHQADSDHEEDDNNQYHHQHTGSDNGGDEDDDNNQYQNQRDQSDNEDEHDQTHTYQPYQADQYHAYQQTQHDGYQDQYQAYQPEQQHGGDVFDRAGGWFKKNFS